MTAVDWERITDRRALPLAELQAFSCTTEPPRSPGGRRLPHPRPWEWEVQAHLRQVDRFFRPGEVLLLGRLAGGGGIVAAAHVALSCGRTLVQGFIASMAVAVSHRERGGAVADEMFHQLRVIAEVEARNRGFGAAALVGKIHRKNRASQYCALRAGLEPFDGLDSPGASGNYQVWGILIDATEDSPVDEPGDEDPGDEDPSDGDPSRRATGETPDR